MKKYKLVLSGSGTRFPAFVGAIKRLLEEGVEIEAIAGTSGGALVGAAYAAGLNIKEIEDLCLKILPNASRLLDLSIFNLFWNWGLIRGKKIEKEIRTALGDKKFKDLEINFKAITVNYNKVSVDRPYEIFCNHSTPDFDLTTAVRASMAIPVAFEPVEIDGDKHIDGGMTSNFGLDVFGEVADNVIGLYMIPPQKRKKNNRRGLFGFVQYLLDLVDIFILGSVAEHTEDANGAKIIDVFTDFKGMDFTLTESDVRAMIDDGYNSVDNWLKENSV